MGKPFSGGRKAAAHRWYMKNQAKQAAANRAWHLANPARRKELNDQYKIAVLDHYGRTCVCCGEDDPRALTADHIDGNGAEDRRTIGGGMKFYHWLVKNNFPPECRIQILCYNCNCMKGIGACCPHQLLSIFELVEAATSFGREVPTRNYAGTSAK